MLQRFDCVYRAAGHHRRLFQGEIRDQPKVQHLTLLIGQLREERFPVRQQHRQRIGFDVAAVAIICRRNLRRRDPSALLPTLIDHFVPSNREQQRHEGILVPEERVDTTEHAKEHVIGDSIWVFAALRLGKRDDLAGKTIPQPLKARRLPGTRSVERSRKGRVTAPIVRHKPLIDALEPWLEVRPSR